MHEFLDYGKISYFKILFRYGDITCYQDYIKYFMKL